MFLARNRMKNAILMDGIQRLWDIPKSVGSYLVEKETGRKFLDFHTGYGSLPLGWNHPELIEAFKNCPTSLLTNKLSNSDFYTDQYLEFIEQFNRLAKPTDFEGGLFFVDAGTLAVDNAIKACFDYRIAGNYRLNPNPELEMIYLSHSFHGRSGFPLSVTDTQAVKTGGYPKHLFTQLSLVPIEGDDQNVLDFAKQFLDEEMSKKSSKIAGLIMEGGIQCEGGDRHLHPQFCLDVQEMCRNYDIPLVVDEVQTGFWSTGEVWGYQRLGLQPDLIAFGKKSAQCGVIAGGVFNQYRDSVFQTSGRINSTWGGNLIDMYRSKHTMTIIQNHQLPNNVFNIEKLYLTEMTKLSNKYPEIKNPRAKGVIMAFDLPNRQLRDGFIISVEKLGLLCLAASDKTVRFRPSLAVTTTELQHAIDIVARYFETH